MRKETRQITVGSVRIGGSAAVSIQSMTKVPTSDVKAVVAQAKKLEACGCEIVRVAVKTAKDAAAIRDIKRRIKMPLVADIHFDHRLALASIDSGADKVRINPGNMRREGIVKVAKAAKRAGIPVRIGINSGSVFRGQSPEVSPPRQEQKAGWGSQKRKNLSSGICPLTSELVDCAMRYIKIFESMDFRDIIISLKASDVAATVDAYRKIAALCDYPLHLGVTAAGPYDSGIVKSAIGIGALLIDGIGDTIRVSLTADPVEEVIAAKRILSATGVRKFGPEIISCPTCGRCQVDLGAIVRELENKLYPKPHTLNPLTIAIMGCEVNGPGEAKEADIGIAFGKDSGMLFQKGKKIKKVSLKDAVKELLYAIR